MDEGWAALVAAFVASALTICGTWLLNWSRDKRADEKNHQDEIAAAVQLVTSLSYDVTLRAHIADTLAAHYGSPLTSLAVLFGLENKPDVPTLLDPMMTTLQELGVANARLWLCGDQRLVAAGNAVQQRAADVIDALMGSGSKASEIDTDAVLQPLKVARQDLVHLAREKLGMNVVELSTE